MALATIERGVRFIKRNNGEEVKVYLTGKSEYPNSYGFPYMYIALKKRGKKVKLDKKEQAKFEKYLEERIDIKEWEQLPNGGYLIFSQKARDCEMAMADECNYFQGRKWHHYTLYTGLEYGED